MYSGNKEYFALKRQLTDEAKVKLKTLPIEQSRSFKNANNSSSGLTFVYEWCDNGTDILGYGCNSQGDTCCLQPQIVPGLFVVTADPSILRQVCALYGYEIEIYNIEYESNSFYAWELLHDYNCCQNVKLVKIITKSVVNSERLYNKFKYNTSSYKYVGISQYFNVGTQIMFEMMLNNNARQRKMNADASIDYSVPKTTQVWMDEYLNVYENYENPTIPLIVFDIETVSSDPHRVPTGDAIDDILFTVSIYHSHTNILYTLIFMPLKMSTDEMEKLIRDDGYDIVPDKSVDSTKCKNILECFASEYDLLKRTMELLTLRPKLHILLGYNSLGYDIKYLLLRCAFYRIEIEHFVWREGYSFGIEQMHLDLFRIIVMRYRFKSYKLDDVSREILKDSKTGVSAVNLRYTFFRMVKYERYFSSAESSERMPSIRDTLEYNNADTLLVAKLEERTKCIPFVIRRAMDCQVPLLAMNTNYNKMQYKLWSECFVVGLQLKLFLTTFKPPTASLKCPIASSYSPTDIIDIQLNLSENLNVSASEMKNTTYKRYDVAAKKAKFPGGANFCLGEINADNVQMYDYVTAYPILMDRKNISDETTTILPASILLLLYPNIKHVETFKSYDYLAHNGSTKSETIILYYQYIYDGLYCGGEFPFTMEELKKRQDSPVILIWEGRRGILSRIIAHFSAVRAATKLKRKALDEIYDILIEKKNDLTAKKILMDEFMAAEANNAIENDAETTTDDQLFGFDNELDADANEMFGIDDGDEQQSDECEMFGLDDDENNENETFGIDDNENQSNNCEMFGLDDDADDDVNENIETNSNENEMFGLDDDDDNDFDTFGIDDGDENEKIIENDKGSSTNATQNNGLFDNLPEIVGRIVRISGNMCAIDDQQLNLEADPLTTISIIAELVALERNNVSNSYDLQKSIVASIYGCVGKMSVVSAAVITSMTRSTLLASAQYCRSLGYKVLYIDTDSIMISGCTEDLSSELNRRYPYMEMEMKLARKCLFVKRKTYYKVEDGNFKYGQNVNGPNAWRECVEFFYNRSTITTNPDIYQAFYDFFMSTYRKLQTFTSVSPEFLSCFTQSIKLKTEYKTMSVAHKFKVYMSEKYPALAGATKHNIFYYLDNSVLLPCLRPELDIKSVGDLRYVNLFKYFQNMYTTIFNLIKFHIRKNNEPYNVTLSSKFVLLLMLKGFLDAYSTTFTKKLKIDRRDIDIETVEPEEVFNEPEYIDVDGIFNDSDDGNV